MNADYVAGFFDGEGWVSLQVKVKRATEGYGLVVCPVIGLTQSREHADVILRIQNYLGFGKIYAKRRCVVLQFGRRNTVKRFINLVKDRVVLKREPILLLEQAVEILGNGKRRYTSERIERLLAIREELLKYIPTGRRKLAIAKNAKVRKMIREYGALDFYNRREELGRVLRDYRTRNHLSRDALGKTVGLTRGTIYAYETGKRVPMVKHMKRILNLMSTPNAINGGGLCQVPSPRSFAILRRTL